MGIKVHGNPMSTATLRVLVALNEKELDFEFVPVDMRVGAHKQQPFISLNPFGQVPALEDGDLKLFEERGLSKCRGTLPMTGTVENLFVDSSVKVLLDFKVRF